jgi:hypothetical protein
VSSSTDDQPETPKPADGVPVWGRAPSPVQAEQNSADSSAQSSNSGLAAAATHFLDPQAAELIPTAPPDPAWTGWDILRLVSLTIVALFVGVFAALFIARWWVYPHTASAKLRASR